MSHEFFILKEAKRSRRSRARFAPLKRWPLRKSFCALLINMFAHCRSPMKGDEKGTHTLIKLDRTTSNRKGMGDPYEYQPQLICRWCIEHDFDVKGRPKRMKTSWYCAECDVALCAPSTGRTCFTSHVLTGSPAKSNKSSKFR